MSVCRVLCFRKRTDKPPLAACSGLTQRGAE